MIMANALALSRSISAAAAVLGMTVRGYKREFGCSRQIAEGFMKEGE